MLVLAVVELLLKVRAPESVPTAVGSNLTWIETAMPGFRVTGKVAPENVKPVPVRLAELTVTAVLPVEVSESDCVAAVPTGSSPKLRVVLLKVSTGSGEAPVPLRLTVLVLPLEELLEMLSVPLVALSTVGWKLTWTVIDWPGDKLAGKVGELRENPVPVMESELILAGTVPVDFTVKGRVAVVPSATVPKLRLDALSARVETPGSTSQILRL
jgi:hypothetical protein